MGLGTDARTRLGAAALLTVVFAAGTALGVAVDSDVRGPPDVTGEGEVSVRRERPDPPNEWIIDRLDLSADQRAHVDSVVRHYGARMSQLQKDYRPQFRSIVDSTDQALKAFLSPEQLVRYDSLAAAADLWRDRNRADQRSR